MSEIVAEKSRSCLFGSTLAHLENCSLNWGFRALLTFVVRLQRLGEVFA